MKNKIVNKLDNLNLDKITRLLTYVIGVLIVGRFEWSMWFNLISQPMTLKVLALKMVIFIIFLIALVWLLERLWYTITND